ncbi:hypothetical protein [Mesorhizobium sp. KR2-14]|uniref:hypothetical protein n=1 Tax=Mesorhizobium sp. KR2-14 TaxID=3156610 RepID=UPI0032B618B8
MITSWQEAISEIERLIAEKVRDFSAETTKNTEDFLAFASGRLLPPNEVGEGYWATISAHWTEAKPAPIEVEIHDDHYEFYRFFDGRTDIKHFEHLPGQPLPEPLIALLTEWPLR